MNNQELNNTENQNKYDRKFIKKLISAVIVAGVVICVVLLILALSHRKVAENDWPAASNSLENSGDASSSTASSLILSAALKVIDFTEAPQHIGEQAKVKGTVQKIFKSKSGTVFMDFCKTSTCPFTAVIFSGDVKSFKNVDSYKRSVTVSGIVRSYKGKAEIVISDPKQIELQ